MFVLKLDVFKTSSLKQRSDVASASCPPPPWTGSAVASRWSELRGGRKSRMR